LCIAAHEQSSRCHPERKERRGEEEGEGGRPRITPASSDQLDQTVEGPTNNLANAPTAAHRKLDRSPVHLQHTMKGTEGRDLTSRLMKVEGSTQNNIVAAEAATTANIKFW
jgi:hypothetical protein